MTVFINRVILTGYLTGEPMLEQLPSGLAVCNVTLGSSVSRKSRRTGKWFPKPNFFDVVIFGGQAEVVAEHMHKGSMLGIDGRLDWRQWDGGAGEKVQEISVIAETVQLIGQLPRTGPIRRRAAGARAAAGADAAADGPAGGSAASAQADTQASAPARTAAAPAQAEPEAQGATGRNALAGDASGTAAAGAATAGNAPAGGTPRAATTGAAAAAAGNAPPTGTTAGAAAATAGPPRQQKEPASQEPGKEPPQGLAQDPAHAELLAAGFDPSSLLAEAAEVDILGGEAGD